MNLRPPKPGVQPLIFMSEGYEERLMLTLISLAIRRSPGQEERFVTALETRKRMILENDRSR